MWLWDAKDSRMSSIWRYVSAVILSPAAFAGTSSPTAVVVDSSPTSGSSSLTQEQRLKLRRKTDLQQELVDCETEATLLRTLGDTLGIVEDDEARLEELLTVKRKESEEKLEDGVVIIDPSVQVVQNIDAPVLVPLSVISSPMIVVLSESIPLVVSVPAPSVTVVVPLPQAPHTPSVSLPLPQVPVLQTAVPLPVIQPPTHAVQANIPVAAIKTWGGKWCEPPPTAPLGIFPNPNPTHYEAMPVVAEHITSTPCGNGLTTEVKMTLITSSPPTLNQSNKCISPTSHVTPSVLRVTAGEFVPLWLQKAHSPIPPTITTLLPSVPVSTTTLDTAINTEISVVAASPMPTVVVNTEALVQDVKPKAPISWAAIAAANKR